MRSQAFRHASAPKKPKVRRKLCLGWALGLCFLRVLAPCAGADVTALPPEEAQEASHSPNEGFLPFTAVYEPSALTILPDRSALILDDEQDVVLHAGSFNAQGIFTPTWSMDSKTLLAALGVVDLPGISDLEGITAAGDTVYAVTSYSANAKGKRRQERELLLCWRQQENDISEGLVGRDLGQYLRTYLAQHIPESAVNDAREGLNIEGLCQDPQSGALLFGLRGPRSAEGWALVVHLHNTLPYLHGSEPPQFSLTTIDLQGEGIRSLHFSPALQGYLLAGRQPKDGAGEERPFHLWFLAGLQAQGTARQVHVAGVSNFAHVEGIAEQLIVRRASQGPWLHQVILVSDDGDSKHQVAGHYRVLALRDLHW